MKLPPELAPQLLHKLVTEAGGKLVSPESPLQFSRPACASGLAEMLVVGAWVIWPGQVERSETFIFAEVDLGHPAAEQVITSPVITRSRLDEHDVCVWRHPFDPVLTQLPEVAQAEGQRLQVYRPMVGATFLSDAEPTVTKVLPAKQGETLRLNHELLLKQGLPVQCCLSQDGQILRLEFLSGTPLTSADFSVFAGDSPVKPRDLITLLQALPCAEAAPHVEAKPNVFASRNAYISGLLTQHPKLTQTIAQVADYLEAVAKQYPNLESAEAARATNQLIHGDFHAGNLLFRDDLPAEAKLALLDLEALRPGWIEEDLGCFLAHEIRARLMDTDSTVPLSPLFNEFARHCSAPELKVFTISNLLALATLNPAQASKVISAAGNLAKH